MPTPTYNSVLPQQLRYSWQTFWNRVIVKGKSIPTVKKYCPNCKSKKTAFVRAENGELMCVECFHFSEE